MTEYSGIRSAAGYELASSGGGDCAHIFGRHSAPLCGRGISPDRDPVGSICGNCRHLAERIGLLNRGEAGGEA